MGSISLKLSQPDDDGLDKDLGDDDCDGDGHSHAYPDVIMEDVVIAKGED